MPPEPAESVPEPAEPTPPGEGPATAEGRRRRRRRRRKPAAGQEAQAPEAAEAEEAQPRQAEAAPQTEPAEPETVGAPRRRRRRRRGGGGRTAAEGATDAAAEGATDAAVTEEEPPGPPAEEEPGAAPAPKRRRRRRAASAPEPDPEAAAAPEAVAEPAPGEPEGEAAPAVPRKRRRRKAKVATPPEEAAPAAAARASPRRAESEAEGRSGLEGEAPPVVTGPADRRRGVRRGRRPRLERQPLLTPRPRTMLITVGKERTQIGVLEEEELVEHYVASQEDHSIVGNIYLGRVQNVLPGMEAAFVNIGEERNAVLYAGEITFSEDVEGMSRRIEKVLKSGQPILAQVTKDPMGSKGARLSTEISLAGRYVVLVPDADSLGVSRRLPDDERTRLRDISGRLRPEGYGLIVRTAARGAGEPELAVDIERLVKTWGEISEGASTAHPPALIYAEPELVLRATRDLLTEDVERVVIDDEDVFREVRDYVVDVTPALEERMEHYQGTVPLFETYNVNEQILRGLDRRVPLPSGGHLVIDRTEAMTVIDVNTGRYVGRSNLEETVVKTNLEAADEVAKQLRLRDIGGIIVIDFIDMLFERNREELVNQFRAALARDKTRTQVYGVSELGLVQMTRKKVSEGLLEAFSVVCDRCEGRGILLQPIDD